MIAKAQTPTIQTPQQSLFGITIDALSMPQAVAQLRQWIQQPTKTGCRFVVTPNVDHTVLLRENAGLRDAYEYADMVLADGFPIVWASRLLGRPLPERVPGSELVPQLFEAWDNAQHDTSGNTLSAGATPMNADPKKLRVFLLGADVGVGFRAAMRMKQKWPMVETVGVYSPPLGFEKDDDESNYILGRIALSRPDVVIVGLGAPKQELWVNQYREQIPAKVALCVGATIDFLAGEKKRAPRWMQQVGLEWFHRMCSEPRRLVKRYAKDAWIFPQLVWENYRQNRFKSAKNCG